MEGAREWHSILEYVGRHEANPCELEKYPFGTGYCWKHKNILFIPGKHARGKTLHICIYKTEEIDDYRKDDHLEVYGVVDGNPGWTERYGFTEHGAWEDYILKYMEELKNCAEASKKKVEEQNAVNEDMRREEHRRKLEEFNALFTQ